MNYLLFTVSATGIYTYSFLTGSRDFSTFLLLALAGIIALAEIIEVYISCRAVLLLIKLFCSSLCIALGIYYLNLHFSSAVKVETFLYMGALCIFLFFDTLFTKTTDKNTSNA